MKIICSSDEEEVAAATTLDIIALTSQPAPESVERPLPPTMQYDSSDHSDHDTSIRKPSKQDRVYAHQIAQKALRELQFELPQRKSKLNMSKFLHDHGITRDHSIEKLMKRMKKKKPKSQDLKQNSINETSAAVGSKEELPINSIIANSQLDLLEPQPTSSQAKIDVPPNPNQDAAPNQGIPETKAAIEENSPVTFITQQVDTSEQAIKLYDDFESNNLISQDSAKIDDLVNKKTNSQEVLEILREREVLDTSHLTNFLSLMSSSDEEELAIVQKPVPIRESAKKRKQTPFYFKEIETRKIVDINFKLARLAEKQGIERREKMIEIQNKQIEDAKRRKQERKIQRQKDQEDKLKRALEIIAQRKQEEGALSEKTHMDEQIATQSQISHSQDHIEIAEDSELLLEEPQMSQENMNSGSSPPKSPSAESGVQLHEFAQNDDDILDYLSGQFPESQTDSQNPPSQSINNWNDSQEDLSDLLSGTFVMTQEPSKLRNDISEIVATTENESSQVKVGDVSQPMNTKKVVEAILEDAEEKKEPLKLQQSRNILDLISESEESDSSADEENTGTEDEDSSAVDESNNNALPLSNPNPVANPLRAILSWNNAFNQTKSKFDLEKQKASKPAARFVETEAEVEEDEFMNYGGLEGEDHEGQDQYDLSLLNDDSAEPINLEAVLELHKQQLKLDDEEQVQALIHDVTSGALRKRKSGKDGSGKGLDMYDSDDESDALLRRIRAQLGVGQSKKDDAFDGSLKSLAENPQTQAFAHCFSAPVIEKSGFLSSSDEEERNIALSAKMARVRNRIGNSRKMARSNSISTKNPAPEAILDFSATLEEDFPILPKSTCNGKEILTRIRSRKTVVGGFAKASMMVSVGSTQITSRLLSKKSIIETGEENLLQNDNGKTFNKVGTGFRAPKPASELLSPPKIKPKKIPREKKATARRLATLIGGRT